MTYVQPFQNLLFLTLVLVVLPAVLWSLRVGTSRFCGRIGLTLFLVMTSSAHFLSAQRMTLMLPDWVPERLLLIYFTGGLELVLAAGLWWPGRTRLAGLLIACMLIALLPANIYAAWNSIAFGGNVLGPAYLWIRIPYQFFIVGWALWVTGWFGSHLPWQNGSNQI